MIFWTSYKLDECNQVWFFSKSNRAAFNVYLKKQKKNQSKKKWSAVGNLTK